MGIVDFDREWEFITFETHKKFKRKALLKREILFALQVLLSRRETKDYFKLKNIFLKIN